MIWGIHYFIAKQQTKIDVIPRGCFKIILTFLMQMRESSDDLNFKILCRMWDICIRKVKTMLTFLMQITES